MKIFYSQVSKLNMIALVFAILISAISIQAQDAELEDTTSKTKKSFKEDWSLGLNFGSSIFYGDLRVYQYYPVGKYPNERNISGGLIVSKKVGDLMSFHGRVVKGKLSGGLRKPDDVYFNAEFFEYSLGGKINLSYLFAGPRDRKLDINLIGEAGMFKFYSAKYNLFNDNFISSYGYKNSGKDKTEPTSEGLLAVGLGMDYKINESFAISGDVTFRGVNTDKLDCTIDDSNLPDFYQYTSLGLVYTFGKGLKKNAIAEQEEMIAAAEAEAADTIDYAKENKESLELVKKKIDRLNKKVESLQETVEGYEATLEAIRKNTETIAEEVIEKEDTTTQQIVAFSDTNNLGVLYHVQVAASYKQVASAAYFKAKYKISQDIQEKMVNNWYKYYVGNYKDITEAIIYKDEVKANGCTGAFIVATNNGKIISINQARALSK